MPYTRRTILKSGTALATSFAAVSTVPNPLRAALRLRPDAVPDMVSVPPIEDPRIKRVCDAALNAAQKAGASYADTRLTHTFTKRVNSAPPVEEEMMTVGVRVLVDGYWGFAASPLWTVDEAARLGRAAVRNAKANTLGKPRAIELAPVEPIENGHWTTPIKDDPFQISIEEIEDFLVALMHFMNRLPHVYASVPSATFVKQEKAFASTANQYVTQRLYRTWASVLFDLMLDGRTTKAALDTLTPATAGFEYLRDQPLRDQILARYEEAKEDMSFAFKPIDVGRYNVVFDALSVANLVSQTIGRATELDRALGYEANAGGTSYITEPLTMAGSLKIGTSALNITANRSDPLGAATVKWDDEGVAPREFTLVKNGVLADMQTNREGAGWLKEYYAKQKAPVVSYGCAYAPEALFAPLTHCANLQLQPGDNSAATVDSMMANEANGIFIKRLGVDMDFQQITGFGMGAAYEIKNGKRVASLGRVGIIFRTPELWNSIINVGGAPSRRRYGFEARKGQPEQIAYHTVTCAPIAMKEITVIDPKRKA